MTDNIDFRFVVVSDGHWGTPPEDTEKTYQELHSDSLSRINSIHNEREIDLLINNGDMVHDDETYHQELIDNYFSELPSGIDWYPAMGNHDWATDSEWQNYYGQSKQQSFSYGDYAFIIMSPGEPRDTNWYCGDSDWLESEIDSYENKDQIFVFHHIPPDEDTEWSPDFGVDCPDIRQQVSRPEVTACFCGHDHRENGLINYDGGTYLFSGRFGSYNTDSPIGLRVVDIKND